MDVEKMEKKELEQLEQELRDADYSWLIEEKCLNTLKEVDTYPKRGII